MILKSSIPMIFAAVVGVNISVTPAAAGDWPHVKFVAEFGETMIKKWLVKPEVTVAVHTQNAAHEDMEQDRIAALDKIWRAQRKSSARPLVDAVMSRPLSRFLKQIQEDSKGLITEIFVMDNKGLNVGQSTVTSDYWQGDEAKWQKTFLVGAKAKHIGNIEYDESTRKFQAQLSLPIVDPNSGAVIGAITVGVDIAALEKRIGCPILSKTCTYRPVGIGDDPKPKKITGRPFRMKTRHS